MSFFAVDTPMCLINYLSANKARKAFVWIAKMNGKKDFYLTLDQIKEIKEIDVKPHKRELYRQLWPTITKMLLDILK